MPRKPARVFFREFEDEPDIGDIFVFGSNLSGIHGKGAAKPTEQSTKKETPAKVSKSSKVVEDDVDTDCPF